MTSSLASFVQKVRPSVVRVFVHDDDVGNPVVGTGSFIGDSLILTCAHVVLLHTDLRELLETLGSPADPDQALERYYKDHVRKVEIQKDDGTIEAAVRVAFNAATDVAIIEVASHNFALPISKEKITEGSEVFYCGYPKDFQMPKSQWPFSVMKGIVSSKVRGQVGGYEENEFFQLQVSMLGGASGSPVFSAQDGGLIGLLNGFRSWGNDGFLRKESEGEEPSLDSLYVPLPLAVATPIFRALSIVELLKKK